MRRVTPLQLIENSESISQTRAKAFPLHWTLERVLPSVGRELECKQVMVMVMVMVMMMVMVMVMVMVMMMMMMVMVMVIVMLMLTWIVIIILACDMLADTHVSANRQLHSPACVGDQWVTRLRPV